MLEKISAYLANLLYVKGEIEEKKIAIIRYGFEIMISSLCIFVSILLYAIVIFRLSDGIIFLLFFMPIRLFSGGYHAPTYKKCYICTMILFIVVILMAYIFPVVNIYTVIVSLVACIVYISQKAPCVNVHHPLSERKYRENKIRARICIIIESIMSIILFILNIRLCTVSVYTLLLVVGMMLFSKGKEIKAC
jgi:accessory gene regulator B